jgi:stage II sporulation protein D
MRGHPEFDVYATSRSQRYLGYQYPAADGRLLAGETAAARETISQTAGIACGFDGRLFCTYYSACCGGRTTPGGDVFPDAAPPLASVPCTWCRDAPLYRWTRTVSRAEFDDRLAKFFARRQTEFATAAAIERESAATQIESALFRIEDGARRHAISSLELRRDVLPQLLPSPRFEVELAGSACRFQGCGSGHGVGLCQWGVRGMALAEYDARSILAHYYPGAALVRVEFSRPKGGDNARSADVTTRPAATAATPAPVSPRGIAPAAGARLR